MEYAVPAFCTAWLAVKPYFHKRFPIRHVSLMPSHFHAEKQFATKPDPFSNQVEASSPPNALVFVGITPCRVVDTRNGSGFTGPFGPPSLVGGATRRFPVQSSTTCSIPSIAQAYSFNITLISFSFVDFITVWPTGQRPIKWSRKYRDWTFRRSQHHRQFKYHDRT